MDSKKCAHCQQNKPLTVFHKTWKNEKTNKQYYSSYCNQCCIQREKAYHIKVKNSQKPFLDKKVCTKCKAVLSVENFTKNNTAIDGYSHTCRTCYNSCLSERRKKRGARPKIKIIGKICRHCNEYKQAKDYHKCWVREDGLKAECKDCLREYYIKNKEKLIKKAIQRRRTYFNNDPIFRLISNLRCRMKGAIKRRSKSASTLQLIGCSGAECMAYLETLFWPGMTRYNYGKHGWAIDHIVPIISFDKTDPKWQFKAFHYTNLQPLWYKDNETKNDRLDWTPAESKYELPERLKVRSTSEPNQTLPQSDNHKEQSKP